MVFPVPVAERLTFLPLIGLSLASSRVTVTVTPAASSTEIELGATAIFDLLAETGPGVKVTVVWREMESTAAVIVFTSALVDLIAAVVCPLTSVGVVG